MSEHDKWQKMMQSCRKACRILGEEFKEPSYLIWDIGRVYHRDLWNAVNIGNKGGITK